MCIGFAGMVRPARLISIGVTSNSTLVLICLSIAFIPVPYAFGQGLKLSNSYRLSDFKLVYKNQAATILTSPRDFKVVQIAANDLASDIQRVTGKMAARASEVQHVRGPMVLIGTLGKSDVIDELVSNGKLNVSEIRNRWESYIIATIRHPFSNIDSALVIVGSDRRGTAYGVYDISQMIGVSPWYWWADVTPEHKDDLLISPGVKRGGEPSVKYRGIFLNDEDWGLEPWAAKTFEPEIGSIGPKTYTKIFELLLRLKANTLWPAMHDVTRPFNSIPTNAQLADDYGIVMGSSHAEPMLRNNVGEWKGSKDDYNFVTNAGGVTDYWEQRLRDNGKYENIYTIGMRGIHDSPIQGTKSQAERFPLLENIFAVQRSLLRKYVDPNIESVPQIFCPYKEVLTDYRAGLIVPDDVTIVFPDDNFGYIRQFPTPDEQKRKGGFGVYYHISYLGRPISYTWLNSTPPALIWEEMSKAYENGMRRFWMLNVGDIKPAEFGIDLFLQMAWDAKRWNVENIDQFLNECAQRDFGRRYSKEIADLMAEYFRLGFQRKPEQLQWYMPGESPRKSDLTEDETLDRLSAFAALQGRAESLYQKIPNNKRAAFYELVLYPIRSAAFANERFFAAELAARYQETDLVRATMWAVRARNADSAIASDAKYFNSELVGGKWKFIMSPEMNSGQWQSMRSTLPDLSFPALEPVETSAIEEPLTSKPSLLNSTKRLGLIKEFREVNGEISIEAEHFKKKNDVGGFSWQVIHGLGKTGDSVSVFPSVARTFSVNNRSPNLEYSVDVQKEAAFTVNFYLLPTQPLGNGSEQRIGFSIDSGPLQVLTIDKDVEVGGQKWSYNVLNETTTGSSGKVNLTRGLHTLKVFAIDNGIVLD
jgi:hypothetical protein